MLCYAMAAGQLARASARGLELGAQLLQLRGERRLHGGWSCKIMRRPGGRAAPHERHLRLLLRLLPRHHFALNLGQPTLQRL